MGNYVSTAEVPQSSVSETMNLTSASRSRRSSVASGTSSVDSSSSAERALLSSTAATPSTPSELDPLSRSFPKPTEDVNLDEMLARKPLKWTLGHYVKEVPTREPSKPAEDKDRLARDMEAKKKEMLAAKEEILRLSAGK
ncbi:hypothetical protein N8I77_008057 [Diaporthe amygdali]|uniref:Uncharacterized protein n=1 Tax=Phomopsis amygdali TaxID=1214568 RepID=A0AAD9SCX6_PHOAM|nr:hypothetical protein N8I77_008057 [Diaporthe amygdali]